MSACMLIPMHPRARAVSATVLVPVSVEACTLPHSHHENSKLYTLYWKIHNLQLKQKEPVSSFKTTNMQSHLAFNHYIAVNMFMSCNGE